MMNNNMAAGPGQHMPSNMPMHPQSRRHQEYHGYAHQPFSPNPAPQSPMHHGNPYANYHPQPAYYAQVQSPYAPQQVPYGVPGGYGVHPQQRWMGQHGHPQYQPPQHYLPQPHQPPFQHRSPVVVSSQPMGQPMTPNARHTPMQAPPPSAQSPRPIPSHLQSAGPPLSPSPAQPPLSTPTGALSVREQSQSPSKQATSPTPPSRRESSTLNPLSLPPEHRTPFYPLLPWYSTPDDPTLPPRAASRRKRRQNLRTPNDALALPAREAQEEVHATPSVEESFSETSTVPAHSNVETPATSQAPSEREVTQVSTPATPVRAAAEPSQKDTPTPTHTRRDTRSSIAVPNIPGLARPKIASPTAAAQSETSHPLPTSDEVSARTEQTASAGSTTPEAPPKALAPKSWADLVRKNVPISTAASGYTNGSVLTNGTPLPKTAPLAEALKQYSVSSGLVAFLEPRGLVNTGNMCYMNSILQVLVFCAPFYAFLDQVRQRTAHTLKSDTPLVDAMIMFMQEFNVLETAPTAEQLGTLLGQQAMEKYGEPLIPEYVYDAIRKLPTFQHMRRGHQQDAEEFLGFLLEGLHDECVRVMQGADDTKDNGSISPIDSPPASVDGWQEVGPKQKASITRTAGTTGDAPSPVTKIFGGNLRSELRVPGLKDSVTLEPYKPLQLDIGAQHVSNIIDALKGITRTETLTGDFGGRGNTAKKQVFIDTVPPVLVLHLKRFEYNLTGTQKIWKKVGYPLELELPKEVFPPAKSRSMAATGGPPRYRLISVVYHHGKSAAGGHYTVDVLRQDSQEWIRIDDTVIRRIRAEDVAEGGAEEDPKVLAKALEQHKNDQELQSQRNIFAGLDDNDNDSDVERPWSAVNGHAAKKSWAGVSAATTSTHGTATPNTAGKRTPTARNSVKDNKVAYILLYEQIR